MTLEKIVVVVEQNVAGIVEQVVVVAVVWVQSALAEQTVGQCCRCRCCCCHGCGSDGGSKCLLHMSLIWDFHS